VALSGHAPWHLATAVVDSEIGASRKECVTRRRRTGLIPARLEAIDKNSPMNNLNYRGGGAVYGRLSGNHLTLRHFLVEFEGAPSIRDVMPRPGHASSPNQRNAACLFGSSAKPTPLLLYPVKNPSAQLKKTCSSFSSPRLALY